MPNRLAGRDQPVPPAAREQPGRLVPVGPGRARPGEAPRPPDLPLDRLRGLPLVPRHGARVVRGRGDGALPQRPLRVDQGRPRGAPRPRPGLHGRGPGDDRRRRLADVGLPDARRPAVLRRDVLPGRAAPRDAVVPPGPRGRRPRLARAARRGRGGRAAGSSQALVDAGPARRPARTIRRPTLLEAATAAIEASFDCGERRLGRRARSSRSR